MSAPSQFPSTAPPPIDIDDLSHHPYLLPTLARWYQQQWQRDGRHADLQQRIEKLQSHLNGRSLPRTWLAFVDTRPAGSVSLVKYKTRGEVDESIWLANLYVRPTLRRRGIGDALINQAVNEAAARGYSQLHLFTVDQQQYYCRRQWQWCCKARVQGQWVDILQRDLAISQPHPESGRQAQRVGHFTGNCC